MNLLDNEDSEFDETDDDDYATLTEDIGGDRVVDNQEAIERNDEDPYDGEHERHELDIFDKAFLLDILDERFASENVMVLPPH